MLKRNDVNGNKKWTYFWLEVLPIFSVTVMMLSDMVDSVIVLNDEHCKGNEFSQTVYWKFRLITSLSVWVIVPRTPCPKDFLFLQKAVFFHFNLQNITTKRHHIKVLHGGYHLNAHTVQLTRSLGLNLL